MSRIIFFLNQYFSKIATVHLFVKSISKLFFNSRNIKYAFHGCKSKQQGINEYYHYIEMIYTDRDASLLRMFDAFIESAPQLLLQIYLILKEQENLKNCEDIEVHSRKFLSSSLL